MPSPVAPSDPTLARAVALHDEGNLPGALAEGGELLASLQSQGVESLSLRYLLATWALEAGDGLAAEAQLDAVVAGAASAEVLAEQARVQLRRARELAYGVDVVALDEARELLSAGDWAAADSKLKLLFLRSEDAKVLRQAEVLRDELHAKAAALGVELLGQVDALLSGPGPYQEAGPLLARIEVLPDGTWDSARLTHLREWYQRLMGISADGGSGASPEQLEMLLAEARALVAAMDYRAALSRFDQLEGTSLQATGRQEAARARDTLVKEERLRAGRMFVAARKKKDLKARMAALVEVQELLASLIEDFSKSQHTKRVKDNLASVAAQVKSLQEEIDARGGSAP